MSYYSEIEYTPEEDAEEDRFCGNCRRIQQSYEDWIYFQYADVEPVYGFAWFCSPKCCRDWLESTYVIPLDRTKDNMLG